MEINNLYLHEESGNYFIMAEIIMPDDIPNTYCLIDIAAGESFGEPKAKKEDAFEGHEFIQLAPTRIVYK